MPSEASPLTIDGLLRRRAAVDPERPFLIHGQQRFTYTQADQAADALASGLLQLGLSAGDRLAVLLPNVPEFVLTLFAAARAGLILVPISIRRSPAEALARLTKTGAKAIVLQADPSAYHGADQIGNLLDHRSEVPDLQHVVATDDRRAGVLAWEQLFKGDQAVEAPTDPQRVAVIVHTLGSSGQPRGAMLTHTALVRNALGVAATLEASRDDVFLGAVPFSNAFGLTPTILASVGCGASLVCLPRFSAWDALALIESLGVTVHNGVPTMFALELQHATFDSARCVSLRTGIMSGAACPPDLVRRVRDEMGMDLILAYGLTEAAPSVTMTRLNDGPITRTETVGRPMDGVELKVIGPEGESLAPGQEGELCVRGYNVMAGYWEEPEATRQVLDAEHWLHTGDLAIIDPDGPVRILGRKDEVINRGGFKIYPGPIEMVLRSFPGIKEAGVVGVPDTIYGELLCACVVPRPGSDVRLEALLDFVAQHLPSYAVPDRVLFFDALPRTRAGTLWREYLRERVRIRGRVWTFGKNVDTDAIIPARRCNTADPRELAKYCMEDADPEFVKKMRRGDIIVADTNFGCGSSREVAPISIKAAGVSAVIAKSFARIFFRNAINIGLPILECPEAVDGIAQGDEIEVEPALGVIRDLTRGTSFQAAPYPPFLQRIIERGGLLAYVEERLAERSA
ncbi:MAG TPA: AMP-binding protein [Anaerolineales bacterium]|nr:AMP-binding protein [Anaerolineales bacterium]